jgi:predicted dehydrogenase
MKKYNWGIIGAGKIARKFTDDLELLPNANLYAVASTSLERAENFKDEFGYEKAYGSYEELVKDENLDIIYVATTNNLHFENTMLCLEHGKAVLCEKPFASNYQQVAQMIEKAREKNVFLMEALWSRFIPSMIEFKKQAQSGILGKIRLLQCDFGYMRKFDENDRVFNMELGGGTIADIGVYTIFMAMYLFGVPEKIQITSVPSPTGSDWTTAYTFTHKNSEISQLCTSFEVCLDNRAKLFGEKGTLILNRSFHTPTTINLRNNRGKRTKIPVNNQAGWGFHYEAAEVMRCLDNNQIESEGMSHEFSLELIKVLDKCAELAKESF